MFHFKKFSIDDSLAAMKIGTDAVLLGAWTPCDNETRILDIGTGSGILALMMAQRNPESVIDAVEIDDLASSVAIQNAMLSPWNDRINIIHDSFQHYSETSQHVYSLIICNPPFFSNSLKAKGNARILARHNDGLPITELLQGIFKLLTPQGKAALIIPYDSLEQWELEAEIASLHISETTLLKSFPSHGFHRAMICLSKSITDLVLINELCIYKFPEQYTIEYKTLTSDFYLNF